MNTERIALYVIMVLMLIMIARNHPPEIKVYDCQGVTQKGEVK